MPESNRGLDSAGLVKTSVFPQAGSNAVRITIVNMTKTTLATVQKKIAR